MANFQRAGEALLFIDPNITQESVNVCERVGIQGLGGSRVEFRTVEEAMSCALEYNQIAAISSFRALRRAVPPPPSTPPYKEPEKDDRQKVFRIRAVTRGCFDSNINQANHKGKKNPHHLHN
jgi:hypothetical protein